MEITYEELLSGNYKDSGDTYPCIIWTEDIDMEQAVRAGIDAADIFRTRAASVNYVSSYSPCVFADLTVDGVAELMAKEKVQRIGYWNEEGGSDAAGTGDCFSDEEFSDLTTHLDIIRVDEAHSVYGVTGAGVRIGQIETGCTEATTVNRQSTNNTTAHANMVYTIMMYILWQHLEIAGEKRFHFREWLIILLRLAVQL